jgi:RND family efflux transporter MFP subunit
MNKNWKLIRGWLNKGAKLFLIIAILAAAIYWFKFVPVLVEKHQVKRGKIIDEVMGTGALDAKIKMIISSKISGRIEDVLVDQGDKVSADQLVVTLDDDQLKLQVKVALANLETVESGVNKVKRDLKFAEVVLSNAVKTYNRYKKLIMPKAISQEKFDKATEELGMARARYSRAEAAVIEAKNKVIEATKVLELRKAQLDDSQIRAPFDGIIINRERDPGNIVIPGSAILSLISTKVLWVRAWVDETELAKIKVGQPAGIIFRSEPEHTYPGKVARIAIEVDRETREFIVDVNVNELPVNWAIGQRAEVYIETEKKDNVLIVSEKYIKWRNNVSGVFVDNGGVTSWHHIKIGLHGDSFIEIIEGLQEGDSVLTPISLKNKLTDQTRISVQ